MSTTASPIQAGYPLVKPLAVCAAVVLAASTATADELKLLAPGAKVTKLADGFKFTEGPAADVEGNVFFTDIPNERIHKWSVEGKLSTFREQSGKANGLYFDKQGTLIACEGGSRQLTAISPDGKVTVLADKYQGKRFNSPNDLWIDPKGGIYFSDPRYGSKDELELDGFHVYYLHPDRKTLVRVTDDLTMPNGVIGTADGKMFYIADAGARKTYRYRPNEDGTLSDKTLFAESGSDGMTLDEQGNLYLTAGDVVVYSPAGKRLGVIDIPEPPANVTFGGKDRKTLFVTARTSLYSVEMAVAGD